MLPCNAPRVEILRGRSCLSKTGRRNLVAIVMLTVLVSLIESNAAGEVHEATNFFLTKGGGDNDG